MSPFFFKRPNGCVNCAQWSQETVLTSSNPGSNNAFCYAQNNNLRTYILLLSGFNFNIPLGSSIDGFVFNVTRQSVPNTPGKIKQLKKEKFFSTIWQLTKDLSGPFFFAPISIDGTIVNAK